MSHQSLQVTDLCEQVVQACGYKLQTAWKVCTNCPLIPVSPGGAILQPLPEMPVRCKQLLENSEPEPSPHSARPLHALLSAFLTDQHFWEIIAYQYVEMHPILFN